MTLTPAWAWTLLLPLLCYLASISFSSCLTPATKSGIVLCQTSSWTNAVGMIIYEIVKFSIVHGDAPHWGQLRRFQFYLSLSRSIFLSHTIVYIGHILFLLLVLLLLFLLSPSLSFSEITVTLVICLFCTFWRYEGWGVGIIVHMINEFSAEEFFKKKIKEGLSSPYMHISSYYLSGIILVYSLFLFLQQSKLRL